MEKPSLEVIKLAHSGHKKWWSGEPLTPAERDAINRCTRFDVTGILLEMLAANASE